MRAIATFKYENIESIEIRILRGNKNEKNEQKRLFVGNDASGYAVCTGSDTGRSFDILFGFKRHIADRFAAILKPRGKKR